MKMNELAMILQELRKCGEMLITISDDLKECFSGTTEDTSVPEKEKTAEIAPPEPAAKKELMKKEDFRAILSEKSRAGYTNGIKNLMKKYGANKLSEMKQEDYEGFLMEMEELDHD